MLMASSFRCVFRIAAGPRIGFGHLMRARALARALGVRPLVSIRGGRRAARVARDLGCAVVPAGVDALKGATLVVVDDPSPRHAETWLARARRRRVQSVAVRDRGTGSCLADLVVDGVLTQSGSTRTDALLGPRFYILDPRIAARRKRPVRRPAGQPQRPPPLRQNRVLIALGGGTHVVAVANRLVTAIRRRCPEARIAVAPGFSRRHPPALPGARWLSPRGLVGPLSNCDVAVLAGGVTLHEGCALGVPIVCLAVVAGQRATIRSFASKGAVIDAGGGVPARFGIGRAADSVARLLEDRGRGRRVAAAARRLVDGHGAHRVARRIRALCGAKGERRV
jgi:spore coat polysaccharide biosynthesis predicted glycosyltransferase SpsG